MANIGNKITPNDITLASLGAAASSHNHSASQITSGTLSASYGGTGVTSIAALKTLLGIGAGGSKGMYKLGSGRISSGGTEVYISLLDDPNNYDIFALWYSGKTSVADDTYIRMGNTSGSGLLPMASLFYNSNSFSDGTMIYVKDLNATNKWILLFSLDNNLAAKVYQSGPGEDSFTWPGGTSFYATLFEGGISRFDVSIYGIKL